jgi:hypothetical protein
MENRSSVSGSTSSPRMPQRSSEVTGKDRRPGPPKVDKKPVLQPKERPAPPTEEAEPN